MTIASPAPWPDLLIEHPEPAVVVLTLNRPKARNALSMSLIEALHRAIADVANDARVAEESDTGPI